MAGPGNRRGMGAMKPKNLKGTVVRLIGYLKPHTAKMILVFVCIGLQTICNLMATSLLTPLLNGLSAVDTSVKLTGIAALDNLAYTGGTDGKLTYLGIMVAIIATIYVLSLSINYLLNRTLIGISTTTMKTMRNQLFAHMQKLPIKVFDSTTHGELMTRYTNDIDMMNEFIARCIPQMVSSVLTIIGVFTVMFIKSWALTLVMIVMLVIMFFVVKSLGGKSKTNFVAQQQTVGKLNGYIEELIEGQKVVKAFNHEEIAIAEFDKINSQWQQVSAKANGYANMMGPIMNNLSHFFYAGIAVMGAVIAINSDQPLAYVGIVAAFLLYIRNVTMPIQQIS
ncbi:MAG: ABC transporter ATP-binding protein, partial [Clostridia bacterium]|nr:ABC transporter ATP-binding protein [Clostridia bacterium]